MQLRSKWNDKNPVFRFLMSTTLSPALDAPHNTNMLQTGSLR